MLNFIGRGTLTDDEGSDEVRSDLGRSSQRKKKRMEKRNQPRNKNSAYNVIAIDDDPQLAAYLQEMSRELEMKSSELKMKEIEIKIMLIDRMNISAEEKSNMCKQIYDEFKNTQPLE